MSSRSSLICGFFRAGDDILFRGGLNPEPRRQIGQVRNERDERTTRVNASPAFAELAVEMRHHGNQKIGRILAPELLEQPHQRMVKHADGHLRLLQVTIRLFHRPLVRLLEEFWRQNPADLLVSVIPHFNRQLCESWRSVYPGRPFVTLITDLADFPPRFWIEPITEQYVIAGTEKAADQARALGHDEAHIFRTSGMILRPDFYVGDDSVPAKLRKGMGLQATLPTGIVLFGGHGSKVMFDIMERLEAAGLPLQLILICGRNERLAQKLRAHTWKMPLHVVGFTKEVPKLMRAADFLIGKPGPGSIAEAMAAKLPVLIECNAWTLPQERYNAEWVREKRVGIVLKSFKDVVTGVKQMLEPATLAEFQRNVSQQETRAIFEIPEILARLLSQEACQPAVNSKAH